MTVFFRSFCGKILTKERGLELGGGSVRDHSECLQGTSRATSHAFSTPPCPLTARRCAPPPPLPPASDRPRAPQVVSAAGDETIRFWKVFDQEPKAAAKRDREEMASSLRGINLR